MNFLLKCILLAIFFTATLFGKETNLSQLKVEVIQSPESLRSLGGAEYYLQFENFPKNEEIVISSWRGSQKVPNEYKIRDIISIDDNGFISCKGKNCKSLTYGLCSAYSFPGERVKMRFSDRKGHLLGEASYFPKPISNKSQKESFSVLAELVNHDSAGIIYLLTLDGITLGEKLHVHSVSASEVIDYDFQCDNYNLIYNPKVIGLKGGHGCLEISRKNGDKIYLELKYGDELIDEILRDEETLAKKYREIPVDDIKEFGLIKEVL